LRTKKKLRKDLPTRWESQREEHCKRGTLRGGRPGNHEKRKRRSPPSMSGRRLAVRGEIRGTRKEKGEKRVDAKQPQARGKKKSTGDL